MTKDARDTLLMHTHNLLVENKQQEGHALKAEMGNTRSQKDSVKVSGKPQSQQISTSRRSHQPKHRSGKDLQSWNIKGSTGMKGGGWSGKASASMLVGANRGDNGNTAVGAQKHKKGSKYFSQSPEVRNAAGGRGKRGGGWGGRNGAMLVDKDTAKELPRGGWKANDKAFPLNYKVAGLSTSARFSNLQHLNTTDTNVNHVHEKGATGSTSSSHYLAGTSLSTSERFSQIARGSPLAVLGQDVLSGPEDFSADSVILDEGEEEARLLAHQRHIDAKFKKIQARLAALSDGKLFEMDDESEPKEQGDSLVDAIMQKYLKRTEDDSDDEGFVKILDDSDKEVDDADEDAENQSTQERDENFARSEDETSESADEFQMSITFDASKHFDYEGTSVCTPSEQHM